MWKCGIETGKYTLCFKENVEQGNFIHDISALWNQIQHLFINDDSRLEKRARNTSVLIACVGKEESALCVEINMPQFRLFVVTDRSATENTSLHWVWYMLPLNEVDIKLGYVRLRWSTNDREPNSAFLGEWMNHRTYLNTNEWLHVNLFSMIRGTVHKVSGSYRFSLLRRALPRFYHSFHVNKFHKEDSQK